jgi:DMSO/TMAO reductase YedYZ molybdopterin-dependent catalytic subunit
MDHTIRHFIIPGIVGARQVKWLTTIKLSKEESSCHWQQNDYKGFHSVSTALQIISTLPSWFSGIGNVASQKVQAKVLYKGCFG